MIIDIIRYLSLALIAISGILLFIFVSACAFPKIFLRPSKANAEPRSRGIKKYTYDNGRAIVYEPQIKIRKYLQQYILSENSGDKFIKCKLNTRVTSVRYTVIPIDANEKILDIIDVEEMITDAGYTKAVILPSKTSYVNLILKEVNGIMIKDRDKVIFSKASVFTYIACSAILSAIISLVIKNATMILWDSLVNLPFLYRQPNNFVPFIIGAGLGAIYAFVMCALYIHGESSIKSHINSKRISKKSVRRIK
ncbi:MAG: hypothetical protein ACI3X1_00130 [Eubacteriales bacterium]